MAALGLMAAPASAETLNFTVNTSEPVVVTGTPRIAVEVGAATRFATYRSGSGTSALTFGYDVEAGDFDANGVTLLSPIELNGGNLADAAGNPAILDFSPPDTSGIKVQTYSVAFATSPITNANAASTSFTISDAPAGASFSYTISSSGGTRSISGAGVIGGASHSVPGIDVSALPSGTLTLSVTISTPEGGTGTASTSTSTPIFTGVLNGHDASADAAYSTQRLTNAYTGPLLTVRRSTDDTQKDIPATIGGRLDTADLTDFCGTASCFVQTWYDQSGNARHAVQAATSRQPRIVNAGTVDALNGLPAPSFNGINSVLTTAIALPASDSVWSTYLVDVVGSGGGGRGRVWATSTGNPSVNAILTGDDYLAGSGSNNYNSTFAGNPRIVSWAIRPVGTASRVWANGTLRNTTSNSSWGGGGLTLLIGDLPAANRALNARVHTIFFGSGTTSTADRQALERWLGGLSGISVP